MSTTQILTTDSNGISPASLPARLMGMAYALLAYGIGAASLFWVFFAAGGFAPYGFSADVESVAAALAINALLVFLFALQHTVMARRGFKQWVARYIPAALERSTFVLLSGLAMGLLVYCWQDVPGQAWTIENTLAGYAIHAVYVVGIVYVLASSFVTNHFELFGLRQAWLYLAGREYSPLPFKQQWMYKYSRHPMMLGILMILWASPDMSVTRLVLAVLLTVYVFAGIRFEERSLVAEFGERYHNYQRQIGLFFTFGRR